ncbi:response regulator [Sphingomonas sp. CJ20]
MTNPPIRLVYIEDDDSLRAIVPRLLQRAGRFDVRSASNAAEAFGLLVQADWNADVILLDYHMPEKNGLELLREVSKVCDAPAIFFTADHGLDERLGSERASVLGIITKPFDAGALSDQIVRLLRKPF